MQISYSEKDEAPRTYGLARARELMRRALKIAAVVVSA
jgi:hypothetical protein